MHVTQPRVFEICVALCYEDATEVLDWLKKQATIFENPSKIILNRGSVFTSHDFNNYCKKEGVQHILTLTDLSKTNENKSNESIARL